MIDLTKTIFATILFFFAAISAMAIAVLYDIVKFGLMKILPFKLDGKKLLHFISIWFIR